MSSGLMVTGSVAPVNDSGSYDYDDLPIDMRFNAGHVVSIVTYSILMIISAAGNITVLTLLLRRRGNVARTRINMMLIHLAIADLLVTFLMMPLEIGWAATVSWNAGDAMCRIMAFFRIFGLYLSSFILICISIDRYHAVLRPLQMIDIDRKGSFMITCAWVASILCSAPQVIIFHVEAHPKFTWYKQCITFNAFPSYTHELIYWLFGMFMMYLFPLCVIIYTYTSILAEMYKRSRDASFDRIRRSSLGFLGRARVRTLKMTIIIVLVFVICWTPYYIMSIWYWVDRDSATQVDQRVQRALFLFACTNSCMNPIVYGAFNIRKGKKERLDTVSSSEKTQSSNGGPNYSNNNNNYNNNNINKNNNSSMSSNSTSTTYDKRLAVSKLGFCLQDDAKAKILGCSSKGSTAVTTEHQQLSYRVSWHQPSNKVRIQTHITIVPYDKFKALGDGRINNNMSDL